MSEASTVATIMSAVVGETRLGPAPIPAADIIAGSPEATWALLWHSEDRTLYNGIWRCTPGIFMLSHPGETITCLSGSATITPVGGAPITVSAGQLAYIPEGTRARWDVHETVLKTFHSHDSTATMIAES